MGYRVSPSPPAPRAPHYIHNHTSVAFSGWWQFPTVTSWFWVTLTVLPSGILGLSDVFLTVRLGLCVLEGTAEANRVKGTYYHVITVDVARIPRLRQCLLGTSTGRPLPFPDCLLQRQVTERGPHPWQRPVPLQLVKGQYLQKLLGILL